MSCPEAVLEAKGWGGVGTSCVLRVRGCHGSEPLHLQDSDNRQAREAWWWSPAVRDLAPGPGTSEQRAPCAWRGLAPLWPCMPTNRFSLCHSWVFSALSDCRTNRFGISLCKEKYKPGI